MPARPPLSPALAVLLATGCAVEAADTGAPPATTTPHAEVAPGPDSSPRTTPTSTCPLGLIVEVGGRRVVLPALCDPREPSPVDPPPDAELYEEAQLEAAQSR
jgi:hypothetical protein